MRTTLNRAFLYLKARWQAETPKIAVYIQWFSGLVAAIIAALSVFWTSLPVEWKENVSDTITNNIVYIGGIAVILPIILQFLENKNKN
jgi:hypothetical protein